MQTVVETPPYLAVAERLLGEDERTAIVDAVANDPRCGVVIPGTGGVRKLRVATSGRGKRGGARVSTCLADSTRRFFCWRSSPRMRNRI
jgi:hypothetical protein